MDADNSELGYVDNGSKEMDVLKNELGNGSSSTGGHSVKSKETEEIVKIIPTFSIKEKNKPLHTLLSTKDEIKAAMDTNIFGDSHTSKDSNTADQKRKNDPNNSTLS